jgi:hypothetical protein
MIDALHLIPYPGHLIFKGLHLHDGVPKALEEVLFCFTEIASRGTHGI